MKVIGVLWDRDYTIPPVDPGGDTDFPLPVVQDWDARVRRANELCRIIDRHLDYEAQGRMLLDLEDFRLQHLCPEQRVQMVTDLVPVTHVSR